MVLNGIDFTHAAAGMPGFDAIKHIGICSEVFSFLQDVARIA